MKDLTRPTGLRIQFHIHDDNIWDDYVWWWHLGRQCPGLLCLVMTSRKTMSGITKSGDNVLEDGYDVWDDNKGDNNVWGMMYGMGWHTDFTDHDDNVGMIISLVWCMGWQTMTTMWGRQCLGYDAKDGMTFRLKNICWDSVRPRNKNDILLQSKCQHSPTCAAALGIFYCFDYFYASWAMFYGSRCWNNP